MTAKYTEEWRDKWLEVMRWRRGVEQALGSQLAFTQWLVLDATALIVRETGDAVSQSQVAHFLRLERMTLSHAMTTLSSRGLVSRGPPLSGICWRIFVTREGSELLCFLNKAVAAVSSRLADGGGISARARLVEICAQVELNERKLERG
jgi:DNA-binding MarR family transcriptional regulator